MPSTRRIKGRTPKIGARNERSARYPSAAVLGDPPATLDDGNQLRTSATVRYPRSRLNGAFDSRWRYHVTPCESGAFFFMLPLRLPLGCRDAIRRFRRTPSRMQKGAAQFEQLPFETIPRVRYFWGCEPGGGHFAAGAADNDPAVGRRSASAFLAACSTEIAGATPL